ncbi:hypothetical protein HJC23_004861 [Cyclotella cryptica]|uniref:Uncharacterized protein n=1 Tax=Cyclotella cryptica TaxID=29204 RepID=A0ABD3P7I3_9STRA
MCDGRNPRWDPALTSTRQMTANLFFSTVTPSPSTQVSHAPSSHSNDERKNEDKSQHSKQQKKDDSNIFLDNLGKIFLTTIALVLLSLLRSTKGNNARAALRDDIEASALLDPLEIEDLRFANENLLTKSVWDEILKEFREVGRERVTYGTFMNVVLRVLRRIHGEGATIQCGHLMDRVVIAEMDRVGREIDASEKDGESCDATKEIELPLSFLLAALSLALYSTVADRIDALYNVMVLIQGFNNDAGESTTAPLSIDPEPETLRKELPSVSLVQVEQMIQHLQNTCQLVPDAQIVETNANVPYQTYRVGDGTELTKRAREAMAGKNKNAKEADDEGSRSDSVVLEDFYAILKSRSVCAWGECYVKKNDRMTTSDR